MFDIHPTWWYLVGTSQFGLHFPQHLFRFDSDSRHWDGVNVTTIDQSCGVAATGKTNQWANRLGSRKRSSEARLGLLRGGLVGGVVGSELGAVASSTLKKNWIPTWGNDPIWLFNVFQMVWNCWNHQLVKDEGNPPWNWEQFAPENKARGPKRKFIDSNHWFSGAKLLFVSRRVSVMSCHVFTDYHQKVMKLTAFFFLPGWGKATVQKLNARW